MQNVLMFVRSCFVPQIKGSRVLSLVLRVRGHVLSLMPGTGGAVDGRASPSRGQGQGTKHKGSAAGGWAALVVTRRQSMT